MTSEKRERLLELFQVQPGYKILDITAHTDSLTRLLAASLVPAGGRLSLVRYPGEHETIAAEEGMTLQRTKRPVETGNLLHLQCHPLLGGNRLVLSRIAHQAQTPACRDKRCSQ